MKVLIGGCFFVGAGDSRIQEPEEIYDDAATAQEQDIYDEAVSGQPQEDDQDIYDEAGSAQQPIEENEYEDADAVRAALAGGGEGVGEAGKTATAVYDYQAADDDEITFDPGEVITNIEIIDDGWWQGKCRGKFGLFPANYVEMNQ